MGLKKLFIIFLGLGILSATTILLFFPELMDREPPKLEDEWWGRGPVPTEQTKLPKDDTTIKKYVVKVEDAVLKDLQNRLNNTRFIEELDNNVQFHYGFRSSYLKEVVKYWRTKYDWRKHEKEMNEFSHFITQIEGINVHFIHQKPNLQGKKLRVLPILLVHGFPDSVYEFHKVIPLLTTPKKDKDYVFEVICPSLPGYGFSEAPHQPGFSYVSAARMFTKLMERLGHKRFYAQGSDWGSKITSVIAITYPERILGLHLNMPILKTGVLGSIKYLVAHWFPCLLITPEEHVNLYPLRSVLSFLIEETGYAHIQATKPDTIGSALADSPAGLAAYVLERFAMWTDRSNRDLPDGGLTKKFTLDELLTNVMVFWCTNSIASSQRLYKEQFNQKTMEYDFDSLPVKVPTGFAVFPNDILTYPKFLLKEKFRNIVLYSPMPRGGHFCALEEPKLLADEIWRFVVHVEDSKQE